MQGPSEEERLRRLAERLSELRQAQDPPPPGPEHHTQAQLAWRMVTELVAGLLVGFGIGYGLDALFGTRPWLLLVFTLLGFAAGVQTMLRTARGMQQAPEGGAGAGGGRAGGAAGGTDGPGRNTGKGQEGDARRG